MALLFLFFKGRRNLKKMEDYKPNSNKYKEEQKALEIKKVEKRVNKPVATGVKIAQKKKGVFGEIISEDARNVKSYVLSEVLIPAIKKAISDIVTDGIDIILYGESRGNKKRSTADRVSYTKYWDRNSSGTYRNDRPTSTIYSFDDIKLDTRGEAEDVLSRMDEIMDTYGLVRVTDFYDLVGVTGNYTDNKYGWMNITSAEIIRVRDGYIIKMPRAVPLD